MEVFLRAYRSPVFGALRFLYCSQIQMTREESSMRTTNHTIYLSDYLTVPVPRKARTRQALRRKIRNRRILWNMLPFLVNAIGIFLLLVLMVFGLTVCAVALGG